MKSCWEIGRSALSGKSYFLSGLIDFLFDFRNVPLKIRLPNLLIFWRPRGNHPVVLRKAFIQRATYLRWLSGLKNHLATYDEATPTNSIRPIHIFCWLSRSAFNLAISLGICLGEKNLSIWRLFELGHLIWPHQDLFTLSSFYILQILVINMTPRWCVSDRLPSWIYSSSQTPEIFEGLYVRVRVLDPPIAPLPEFCCLLTVVELCRNTPLEASHDLAFVVL